MGVWVNVGIIRVAAGKVIRKEGRWAGAAKAGPCGVKGNKWKDGKSGRWREGEGRAVASGGEGEEGAPSRNSSLGKKTKEVMGLGEQSM